MYIYQDPVRCGIFVFCLLSFPQNERKIYKLRQLSLPQFVYFMCTEPSMFRKYFVKVNIDGSVLKKYANWDKTKLSQFVYFSLVLREWEETKTKYSTPNSFESWAIYLYFYKILSFVKVNIDGSALKKCTNWYKLSCLSLYIFLSFSGNERRQKNKYYAP